MKKSIIILAAVLLLFCTACGEDNTSESEDYIVYSGDSGSCGFEIVENIDELADYIIDNRHENTSKAFEHSAQKDNASAFTMYTLENIPSDYQLENIRLPDKSSLLTMNYSKTEGTTGSKIAFVWDYKNNGELFFQETIDILGLEPLYGMSEYYYVQTVDDWNQSIYQIYWVEDEYKFQTNIPVSLIGDFEENDTAVLTENVRTLLTLKKTDYPVE